MQTNTIHKETKRTIPSKQKLGHVLSHFHFSISLHFLFLNHRCDTGFGHALARQLSAKGYRVLAGCLDAEGPGAQSLAGVAEVVPLDITNDISVQNAAERVRRSAPQLWALVNNAGISTVGELEWCNMEQTQRIFDVNVFGALRLTRALLPMIRHGRGRVVNVSSYTSKSTIPFISFVISTLSDVVRYSLYVRKGVIRKRREDARRKNGLEV
ncbi:BDH1 [Cordylochernes scorpioides]|uniref:BDH1 n=1 Tax=Cordylochernes scorpioides TaxID=51811 RepID=A0ABY6KT02_9ARAC|nr:BDH1 [Cordylochernes scorpioides]